MSETSSRRSPSVVTRDKKRPENVRRWSISKTCRRLRRRASSTRCACLRGGRRARSLSKQFLSLSLSLSRGSIFRLERESARADLYDVSREHTLSLGVSVCLDRGSVVRRARAPFSWKVERERESVQFSSLRVVRALFAGSPRAREHHRFPRFVGESGARRGGVCDGDPLERLVEEVHQ